MKLSISFSIVIRFGSGTLFSCMRFEALHQRAKRYSKNCGFKNAPKTIATKFAARQSLVLKNPKEMGNPFLDDFVEVNELKSGEITAIFFNGHNVKKNKKIIIMNKEKVFMRVDDFEYKENVLHIKGKKFENFGFHEKLLAYKVKEAGSDLKFKISEILPFLGSLYKYSENDYCLFNTFIPN